MNDSLQNSDDAKAGAQLVAPAHTPTTLDRGPGERALLASVANPGAQGPGVGSSVGSCWYRQQERAVPCRGRWWAMIRKHNPQGFVLVMLSSKIRRVNMGCPGKSCLLGIQRNLLATLYHTRPQWGPLDGPGGQACCLGRGARASHTSLAAPHGRKTVPAPPQGIRCAVGWELREQRGPGAAGSCTRKRPALPVDKCVFNQMHLPLTQSLEALCRSFKLKIIRRPVWAETCKAGMGWGAPAGGESAPVVFLCQVLGKGALAETAFS